MKYIPHALTFFVLQSCTSDSDDINQIEQICLSKTKNSYSLARELGHTLGLKNMVKLKGNLVVNSDLLSDALSCSTKDSCEADRRANELIMFPYSLKPQRAGGPFLLRDKLSEQQAIIIRSSLLVINEHESLS